MQINVLNSEDIIYWLDNKKPDVKIGGGENANVNINSGNLNVSFDTRMAAAVSVAAGANAGIQVAKYLAGPPVKIGADVSTAVGVQAITTVMDKVLASNSNQSSSK